MSRLMCSKRKLFFISICLVAGLFFTLAPALASEGGGHGDGKMADLFYRFLNFALLVIILFIVAKKTSLTDFFTTRRKEIETRLEELQKERDEAEKRFKELEQELKDFETTREEVLERYRAEGEAEKEMIISQAEERASHILKQVDLTIEAEVKAARDRLREEIAAMAAGKAEEIIKREITDSDQDHLVDEFIERMEKLH